MTFKSLPSPCATVSSRFWAFRSRSVPSNVTTRWTSIARSIRDIFYWWTVWIVLGRRRDKLTGSVVHVTR